jgi:ABC-2 type transport system ATP-binding protein
MHNVVIDVEHLAHKYEKHQALNDVSFQVMEKEIFGFLGPNGGGKTTIFKIISTLVVPTGGTVTIKGNDVVKRPSEVRKHIGVVFQSSSLDGKLTVEENLRCQGFLQGLHGSVLVHRIEEVLDQLGMRERKRELVEKLSGGQQRRIEIGKGLLHHPDILILDEPSTGLDPGARRDLWMYLLELQRDGEVTIIVTSHILEEAEHCHRLAILDKGQIVALGTPDELKHQIGGDVINITVRETEKIVDFIKSKIGGEPVVLDNTIRIEKENGHRFVPQIIEAFPGYISSISVSKPTLEDVFIRQTGHRLWQEKINGESR